MVLGRDGGSGDVELLVTGLDKTAYLVRDGKVRVAAARIPDSGWKHLECPTPMFDKEIKVSGGELKVTLPDLGPDDACIVVLG